jgi:AraC family transcriptional regulator
MEDLAGGTAMRANPDPPATTGVYGPKLGGKFGAEYAPFIVTRTLQRGEIAVTELCVDRPLGRLCDPLPRLDAYMICFLLRDLPNNSYWEDGREVSLLSPRAGEATIHDLQREPLALMDKPIHSLLFYLPRAAMNALADQANVPRVSELRYTPGEGVPDETVRHISLALLPALRAPECASRLFTDHATLALAAHAAQVYGGMQTLAKPLKGGLAPWQEKRSKEMIAGDLSGTIPLRDIADACEISVSHFSRAFRRSTGLAPHAWLIEARVESAKSMLRDRKMSLSAIARACGFADQSHFSRTFTRRVGLTPGAWRKTAFG